MSFFALRPHVFVLVISLCCSCLFCCYQACRNRHSQWFCFSCCPFISKLGDRSASSLEVHPFILKQIGKVHPSYGVTYAQMICLLNELNKDIIWQYNLEDFPLYGCLENIPFFIYK